MTKLECALAARDAGFFIIPVPAGQKGATLRDWPKLATRDPEQIRSWWREDPGLNYGIVANRFGDAGERLVILDVDNKKGKNGGGSWLQLELDGLYLPQTYRQETPNGGYHYFFRTTAAVDPDKDALGGGIDIQHGNKYVLGAGSRIDEGTQDYTGPLGDAVAVAPAELIGRLARRRPQPAAASLTGPPPSSAPTPVHPQDIARAIAFLEHVDSAVEGDGGDAHTLSVAMRVKDLIADPGLALELMLEWWNPNCEPPWEPYGSDSLETKIRSAYSSGKGTPGEKGFHGIAGPVVAFATAPLPVLPTSAAAAPANPAEAAPRKLRVVNARDVKYTGPALTLVDGVLEKEGVAFLFAQSGAGKSFVALDLAFRIAVGMPWHARKVDPGQVVYLAAEAAGSIERRTVAWLVAHPEVKDVPLEIVSGGLDLFGEAADVVELIATVREIAAARPLPVRMIVIDTMAEVSAGADENSAQDMGVFLKNAKAVARATNALVLLVHHTGKDGDRGLRGSSKLRASANTTIEIRDNEIRIDKQKDGDDKLRFAFELQPVKVPAPEGSEAPFFEEMIAVPRGAAPPVERELTDQQKEGLESLRAAVDIAAAPDGGATVEAWREEFEAQWSGESQNPATKRKAFSRVRRELTSRGIVRVLKDRAWPADTAGAGHAAAVFQAAGQAPNVSGSGHAGQAETGSTGTLKNALDQNYSKPRQSETSRDISRIVPQDQPRQSETQPWKGVSSVAAPDRPQEAKP